MKESMFLCSFLVSLFVHACLHVHECVCEMREGLQKHVCNFDF
jgi:hypothetical protein